eukprot:CAMPEP_0113508116 /NCGR_PEP_ID=MMETSP0014_2-20120614/36834_1 /TAXON_ID=2857 /ORGANISM="Nitzschia sp." /LENGTH=603 /DNA_ID=CAMNT_0000403785 /DNA_START=210 /DNA_END=2020 /DNA_ORIENTATION=+ /assembly_acc=CAM_ASM_000159
MDNVKADRQTTMSTENDREHQPMRQKQRHASRRHQHRRKQHHVIAVIAMIGFQILAILLDDTNYTGARPATDEDKSQQDEDVLFSSTNIQPRIIGGTETVIGRFPYHVSLLDDFGGHTCGGTLVAPDVVLTAAHCDVLNKAQIGRYDRSDPFETFDEFKITSQIIHPAYSPTFFTHDVMMLKLEGPSQRFPVVSLNSNPNLPVTEEGSNRVTAVGFGVTEYNEETGATNGAAIVLQTVGLNAITNEQCEQSNDLTSTDAVYQQGYRGLISDDMICADGAGDTCLGDSGGPLIIPGSDLAGSEDVQVGVTSWGFGCGQEEFPGVYARVSDHMTWIQQQVCAMSSNPPSSFQCDETVMTPPREQRQITVTIIIKFDDFPAEVGWRLKDDTAFGVVVNEILPGYYSSEAKGTTVYETLNVTEGSSYSFSMLDAANDGLCCSGTSGPGSYLVVYGTNETGEVLVSGGGENGLTHSFTVRSTTDAPTGSPYPTGFPSSAPSITPSFAPSSVPSSNPTVSPVPTSTPSAAPSDVPSLSPTIAPTATPSSSPSLSFAPSISDMPSEAPSTSSASKRVDSMIVVVGVRDNNNDFVSASYICFDMISIGLEK